MRPNTLRRLKAEGKPIVNAWLSIGAPYAAEAIAHQGFDAATIDCQHGMIGFDTAIAMLQAVSSTPAIPMVRPSGLAPAEIMRFLDAGSYGVICPMISTADDAARLVAACRYPPKGVRSFGPARGMLYGGADYLDHANDEILVLAMIETREGLDNLDTILDVEGLDGIYVGPNDLGLALGHRPLNEPEDGPVAEAIEHVRAATNVRGLISGIFCSNGTAAAMRVAQGFDLVTPGNDAALLRATMADAVKATRR
ncbi:2,4-dihydroxyhept-2-ene-1,7-dioic acid aldolase [Croceicoccus ponticola]|uniref:2,4-dihydroxyhept-2-ene-1,7-dioic acid aldolase n=1 Tax=Croceicoccus ponticola TaxID=2217664 RepID=A0A437GTY4_9SPHN|nr:aldolase/citrate lyase family protein [Croceicoccus ponticola]RVQ64620.1 2,4-dihydroxyhept-2-ene-1,7-dioic acid aldolase [Croceicoccus ponticola]